MSDHAHSQYVEGCYRCDLSRDEVEQAAAAEWASTSPSTPQAQAGDSSMSRLPSHITLNEAEGRIDCATCSMGMDAPPSFGGIPRADLIASFIVQHADHNARGVPNGLTASGRPTKRAVAALRADQ